MMDEQQEPYQPTFWEMELPITDELRQMVKEYHEYHGDRSSRIVKVVRDDVGYPALLVRVRNRAGAWYSCIDSYGGDYISEIASTPTDDEECLLCWYCGEKNEEGERNGQDD